MIFLCIDFAAPGASTISDVNHVNSSMAIFTLIGVCMLLPNMIVVSAESNENLSLIEILQHHSSLVVDKWEQYLYVYEDILAP